MSFRRAACAALSSPSGFPRIAAAVIVILAGLCLSCGSSDQSTPLPGPNHNAYVTLPAQGSVLLLQINGATGAIALGSQTPQTEGLSPNGLALLPSKKFLYTANSRADTISIFNVGSDGTLTLTGAPTQAGNGPYGAVIDPLGQYLLVTNSFGSNPSGGDISVFSINPSTGVLTPVGTPVPANANPTDILFTHSGQFVYVTNPGLGTVTAFSFSAGVLTPLQGSPVFSGAGASALAGDPGDQFLYVVNPSASNPAPFASTIGNISAFSIDSGTGALTPILGSPFTATNGIGPSAIAVDPSGRFVYAASQGSSFSIWCFTIDPTNGELALATNSPFSQTAGGLFALFDPNGDFFYMGSASGSDIVGYTYNSSTGALTAITDSPFATGAPGKMVLSE